MRFLIFLPAFFFSLQGTAQAKLEVHDLSQIQLRVMERYRTADSVTRTRIFIDSIYTPFRIFWNGYLGEADVVANWLNESLPLLEKWKERNKAIDGSHLKNRLAGVASQMQKLTGYRPSGNWYIAYGPAWTDLGGLGDFAMLIDLAHSSNSTTERIVRMFPHELTHQVMTNVNPNHDTTAIASIIGEGFAVWMNKKYWKDKYTVAQNLGYSEAELDSCVRHIDFLKKILEKYAGSADKNVIEVFRSRGEHVKTFLPGAIGYYIGYRIVESYVARHGKNSWKDIFVKSPQEIYATSGF